MNGRTEALPASRFGRLASKITRRLAGFVLLCYAIGMSTCSALEAVKEGNAVQINGAGPVLLVPAPVTVSL